jgi:hypothetical protein
MSVKSEHECEFCGTMFKTSNNLTTHKKSAKYCLSIRNATGKPNTCVGCGKNFTYAASLTRHISVCKKILVKDTDIKELNEKIVSLEKELEMSRSKVNFLEKENLELKLLLENGKGQLIVYEKHPGVVHNTQYINPKLTNIKCDTISPLTLEYVQKQVSKYTYEEYIRGELGLVDYIAGLIVEDDQRNYVCTDTSRNKFHRLIETREWKEDNGAHFLNTIFDSLKEPATTYYHKIAGMYKIPGEQETGDFLMDRTKKMFFGIAKEKSKDRADLFNKIRTEVRTLAAV